MSMNLTTKEIQHGETVVEESFSEEETELLASKLREQGFELLDDPNACIVEAIRVAVLEWVRMEEGKPKLSVYVSQKICKDYSSLSKLFSQVKGGGPSSTMPYATELSMPRNSCVTA